MYRARKEALGHTGNADKGNSTLLRLAEAILVGPHHALISVQGRLILGNRYESSASCISRASAPPPHRWALALCATCFCCPATGSPHRRRRCRGGSRRGGIRGGGGGSRERSLVPPSSIRAIPPARAPPHLQVVLGVVICPARSLLARWFRSGCLCVLRRAVMWALRECWWRRLAVPPLVSAWPCHGVHSNPRPRA